MFFSIHKMKTVCAADFLVFSLQIRASFLKSNTNINHLYKFKEQDLFQKNSSVSHQTAECHSIRQHFLHKYMSFHRKHCVGAIVVVFLFFRACISNLKRLNKNE